MERVHVIVVASGPSPGVTVWTQTLLPVLMIMLFIVLARNKLRIPLEGTYSGEM